MRTFHQWAEYASLTLLSAKQKLASIHNERVDYLAVHFFLHRSKSDKPYGIKDLPRRNGRWEEAPGANGA
jgi:hypothetical protein